ncbi:hypothetical protein FOZ63_031622 [Perkinsus olseni]|uniref:Methyltransferase type 11 domain-containing protein n=1 Tax=Perkinsus olseni TaxID=32597 RepID=A0A7J6RR06_PEROL|nr:hypothetical protein FOZ62_002972 [Perkinsus olseni]KAF4742650.1 hypothetical protein FOZ63_031622 [Perkinsus olseni]
MSECPEEVTFDPAHYPNGPNKGFEESSKEELLDKFLPIFEGDRQLKNHLDSLMHILDLKDNTVSVDVGAGTGLLTRELAKLPGAKVYATEISQGFLDHLREDTRIDENKVELVKCTEESLCLPDETTGAVDLAVLCDVYHHFTHPRAVLSEISTALKNDGRMVLVDYWKDPEKSSKTNKNWVYEHLRGDKKDFVQEITAAGFRVVEEPEIQGVEENYAVVFKKDLQ